MKKKTMTLLFGVLLVLSLCSCGIASEEPEEPQVSEEERMQQLLDDIDHSMSERYDGCSISNSNSVIKVDVWSDSISDVANTSTSANDTSWKSVKNEAENNVISTVSSIKSAGFSSMMISFNILDGADHSKALLSFDNSGVSYDIVAEKERENKASEPRAEEEKPDAPSSENTQSGRESNFNTHNNPEQQQTSDSYVLNTSTMKFHTPSCEDVSRIAPENYSTSDESKSTIISMGYSPCGHCNP